MKANFKTIMTELEKFIDCYVEYLKVRNSFRQSKFYEWKSSKRSCKFFKKIKGDKLECGSNSKGLL